MNKIAAKLNKARKIVLDKGLKPTGYNSFAKYNYWELHDVVPHGLSAFHDVGLSAVINFEGGVPRMDIYDCDEDSPPLTIYAIEGGTASLKGCHSIQNLGACISYYRRFLWLLALELSESSLVDTTEPDSEKLNFQIKDLLADIRKKLGKGGTKDAPEATKKVVQEMFGGNWQSLAQCKDPAQLQAVLKTFGEDK